MSMLGNSILLKNKQICLTSETSDFIAIFLIIFIVFLDVYTIKVPKLVYARLSSLFRTWEGGGGGGGGGGCHRTLKFFGRRPTDLTTSLYNYQKFHPSMSKGNAVGLELEYQISVNFGIERFS